MVTDSRETAVWSRAIEGDSSAFARLFDQHHDRVFRHTFWLLRDVHDAEDASATVFLELWRRRHTVRIVDGSILPWLLVTATNVCRNLKRASARYRALIDSLPRETVAPDADADYLQQHLLEAVDPQLGEALARLSGLDLRLFMLVTIERYPIQIAAAAVGVTDSAAKTRLHRTRKRLKAELTANNHSGLISTHVERGAAHEPVDHAT